MNIDHLIKMANQIGSFFEAMPDRPQAVADAAAHIKRSWEPRMCRELLDHVDRQGGAGLSEFAREAVERVRGG